MNMRTKKRRIYRQMGYQIAGRPITNTRNACNALVSRFKQAAHKACEAWAGLSRALTQAATRITNGLEQDKQTRAGIRRGVG
ncbi:hypothetical protein HNP33_002063 [Comamonas odontotermitis]|uniref:Transposase n=1 Tax=Comamonas odontotermitis TaxID=379895 RepID=A0ABR6RFR4_9BURK|nr:hypothetical protein [Comamonas odontotermitis]MBB6577995.1 hypothetical protein [Comamonas odontotermitis]